MSLAAGKVGMYWKDMIGDGEQGPRVKQTQPSVSWGELFDMRHGDFKLQFKNCLSCIFTQLKFIILMNSHCPSYARTITTQGNIVNDITSSIAIQIRSSFFCDPSTWSACFRYLSRFCFQNTTSITLSEILLHILQWLDSNIIRLYVKESFLSLVLLF